MAYAPHVMQKRAYRQHKPITRVMDELLAPRKRTPILEVKGI